MDNPVKWTDLTLAEQMVNVGNEVRRAFNAEKKGNEERMKNECLAAVNMLALMMSDPRNLYRQSELLLAERVLVDYFFGGNTYNSSEEGIRRYYDVFIDCV